MNNYVVLSLSHRPDSPPVRERQFAVPTEAPKHRNNVLWSLVGLIDYDDPSIDDGTKKRRIGVSQNTALEVGGKH